jgi:hypothetical protein
MMMDSSISRASLTVFVTAAIVALISTGAGALKAKTSGYDAPANHRQLIVRKLKETHYAPYIRRALISRPYEEWMGLINGGHRPAVCVEIYRETPLFTEVGRDIWIFSFQDGQIDSAGMGYPGPGCKDLSPLNEVVKRK